jgi:anti-sigma factor RsiW
MTMEADDNIDDKLLGAWLDGELAAPERAADRVRVEAWLREHPEDAARVRLWAADAEALRARLGVVLDEPVPDALQRVVWRRSGLPRWALAASAAGLLVLGGALGAGLVWQSQQRTQHQQPRWLTARIKLPVKLFDLHDQGFELVGGRLLPDGPGKSAQLMYQDPQGVRITVYLRKPEDGTEAAFRYERQGDLGLFYWVEEGLGYALVGTLPKDRLLALAEVIYKQHPDARPAGASAPGS